MDACTRASGPVAAGSVEPAHAPPGSPQPSELPRGAVGRSSDRSLRAMPPREHQAPSSPATGSSPRAPPIGSTQSARRPAGDTAGLRGRCRNARLPRRTSPRLFRKVRRRFFYDISLHAGFRELSPQVKALTNKNKELKGSPLESAELETPKASVASEISIGIEPQESIQVGVKTEHAELDAVGPQAKPVPIKTEPAVMQNLVNLYKDLSSSDIFAAQRLSEAWLPRPTKTHGEAEPNSQTQQSANNEVPSKHASQISRLIDTPEEFKSLAQPVSEPSMAQLTKWVAALEPDSDYSQQAAHMLTQGQMMWQSELAPGIPMRIVREDAWRNAANKLAQLEKGAMLKVEVELPNLGRIRITGSQWGQDLSIQVAHAANSNDQWASVGPSLLQDLQASGISDVRLETLADDPEVPNG